MPEDQAPINDLTKLRREPQLAAPDWTTIRRVLGETYLCHLGFADEDGQGFAIPTIHALVGDELLIHGSAASRTLKTLDAGAKVCVTVSEVDGLVLSRSVLNHNLNFRSVMVFGQASIIPEGLEKAEKMHAFFEAVFPGRWEEAREPTEKESKRMALLKLPLEQASAKINAGPPEDEEYDYELDVWAGVIPLSHTLGEAQPDPALKPGIAPSPSIEKIKQRWAPHVKAN